MYKQIQRMEIAIDVLSKVKLFRGFCRPLARQVRKVLVTGDSEVVVIAGLYMSLHSPNSD